jgi:hypothetical protein
MSQSIGIKGLCKECHNARTRQRYAANTDAQRLAMNARDRAAYAMMKA